MGKQHGPWIIKSTDIKHKSPWIEVREDKVIRPDGQTGTFSVVTMKHGVSVLPLDQDRYVYLTQEFHYAVGVETIETVSGAIDGRETPLEAAKRELQEELGIEALEWVDMGMIDPFTAMVFSHAYLFLARGLRHGGRKPEGTETIKQLKVQLKEAVQMVRDGRIAHGPSCVLILKTQLFLQKHG